MHAFKDNGLCVKWTNKTNFLIKKLKFRSTATGWDILIGQEQVSIILVTCHRDRRQFLIGVNYIIDPSTTFVILILTFLLCLKRLCNPWWRCSLVMLHAIIPRLNNREMLYFNQHENIIGPVGRGGRRSFAGVEEFYIVNIVPLSPNSC